MTKKNLTIVVLGLIVALGFLLRFYRLSSIPAGLHYDEVLAGYNAFLIKTSQRNLLGEKWPLTIDSFRDYRPAAISYLTVPFVIWLGLNELSTRLPEAVLGTFSIVLTYLLTKSIFKEKKIALLASLLMAISPCAVVFNRTAAEANIDALIESIAIMALIFFLQFSKVRYLVLAYFFWFVGYFTYQSSRIISPVAGICTIILAIRQFHPSRRTVIMALIALVIYVIFPFTLLLRSPIGYGRFSQVNVLSYPEVQRSLDEFIREDGHGSNVLESRLFHNKIVGYSQDIFKRYTSFFSPREILFNLRQPEHYFVPNIGAITFVEFAGLVLAVGALIYRKQLPMFFLPLVMLLLAPFPAAATYDGEANLLRAIIILPYWQIIAAFGIVSFIKRLNKQWMGLITICVCVLAMAQLSYFSHQYFVHQTARVPYTRDSEMKQLALFLRSQKLSGEMVLMSNYRSPYLFYLFYDNLDVFNLKVVKQGRYYFGDLVVDGIRFSDSECINGHDIFESNYTMAVFSDYCRKPNWAKKIAEFRRLDGSLASEARSLRSATYDKYKLDLTRAATTFEMMGLYAEIDKTFIKI